MDCIGLPLLCALNEIVDSAKPGCVLQGGVTYICAVKIVTLDLAFTKGLALCEML